MYLEKFPRFLLDFSENDMHSENGHFYEFKSFRLNLAERQLLNAETPVPLTPKAFDVLAVLVEQAGHLVEKDELMQLVWPDAFVEEANVARIVHTLRKVLNEDENGNKFIETVAKKGYRFVAPVTMAENVCAVPSDGDGTAEDLFPVFKDAADARRPAQPSVGIPAAEVRHVPWFLLIGAGFLLAIALIATLSFYRQHATRTGQPVSIAVMPLRSLNKDEQNANYKLAVADSLVTQLSAASELTVRPLSATWQYLDTDEDAIGAGKELKVDYVVTSNYQIVDGKIRVTSQLINVERRAVVDTFKSEREIAGDFQTQDMIATDVGGAIVKRFGILAGDVIRRRGTANEEAFRYVIQAAYSIDNKRGNGVATALELLQKAIELDPNYARAFAVRAYAYRMAAWTPELGIAPEDCYLRAKEAVETALRLDPNSSDTYVMLGEIKDTYEWKSGEADAAHRRSIELDPNSAHARRFYALFLINERRFDEAIEQIKSAIDIEPASIFGQQKYGQILYTAQRYDEAIVQLKRVREMDPNFREGGGMIWRSYYLKGDRETAYAEFRKLVEKAIERKRVGPDRLARLDQAYANYGWHGVFRSEVELLQSGAESVFGNGVDVYIGAGNNDKAIATLEQIAAQRNRAKVVFLGPWLDPLRPDPRFQALMKKLGY